MINFDAVDFSERRSEEVMFLLTLSVYLSKLKIEHLISIFSNCMSEVHVDCKLQFLDN